MLVAVKCTKKGQVGEKRELLKGISRNLSVAHLKHQVFLLHIQNPFTKHPAKKVFLLHIHLKRQVFLLHIQNPFTKHPTKKVKGQQLE